MTRHWIMVSAVCLGGLAIGTTLVRKVTHKVEERSDKSGDNREQSGTPPVTSADPELRGDVPPTTKLAGVRLMSLTDVDAQKVMSTLTEPQREMVRRLLPYVTGFVNTARKRVMALAIRFTTVRANGLGEVKVLHLRYPDSLQDIIVKGHIVAGESGIGSGTPKLISADIDLSVDSLRAAEFAGAVDAILEQRAEVARKRSTVTSVRISLDTVIFADGELVGQDASNLADDLVADYGARQEVYRLVLQHLSSGESVAGVVESLQPDPARQPASDSEGIYRVQTVGDLRRLSRQLDGDELLTVVQQMRRSEPFKVWRRGSPRS